MCVYKNNVWKIDKEYFEQITNFKKSRHFRSIIISHGKKNHRNMFCFGVFFNFKIRAHVISWWFIAVIYMCAFWFLFFVFYISICFYTSVVIVLFDRPLIAMYTQNNYRYSTFASNLVSPSSCISDYLLRSMSRFKRILIIYFRSKKQHFVNSLLSLVE